MEKKLSVKVGTIVLSITLLSGCGLLKNKDVVINHDNVKELSEEEKTRLNQTIDLEDKVELVTFYDYRTVEGSIYTYDDLDHINSLIIRIDDDFDYSFLNELHNLEFLHLDDYSSGKSLRNIDGSNFNNKVSITITMNQDNRKFTKKRYPFLENIKEINNLILGSEEAPLDIDDDFLEKLNNVHNLYLSVSKNTNIDYDDLEHLDYLYIDGDTKYVDLDDISDLKENGVKVKIKEK